MCAQERKQKLKQQPLPALKCKAGDTITLVFTNTGEEKGDCLVAYKVCLSFFRDWPTEQESSASDLRVERRIDRLPVWS